MTVRTVKSLCLKADTQKAKDIHNYYLNLEEVLHEVVDEQTTELSFIHWEPRKIITVFSLRNFMMEKVRN